MKKNIFIMLIMSIVCITNLPIVSYASTYSITENESFLMENIKNLRLIDNSIYILGKSIINSKVSEENKERIIREIDSNISKIQLIKNDLNRYKNSIKDNSVELRNTMALIIATDYYRIALEELRILVEESTDNDIYDNLSNYFYDKYFGSSTLDWVELQIKR